MEAELSFSESILKDVYHYILYSNIFCEACFFSICRAIVTHRDKWTIVELQIEKGIHDHGLLDKSIYGHDKSIYGAILGRA